MYHESARGRYVLLGWYWCELLRGRRVGEAGLTEAARFQEEMLDHLAAPSGTGQEARSEFLKQNPLLAYWPLGPHGESNPALLLRDDGSLAETPRSIVEKDARVASGGARRTWDGSELLAGAQRLISGGLAPLVAGALLLAPITGFVPWSALTGKLLTTGYAVALTYLAASEAARKLAGRKPDSGEYDGLSFYVDDTQFHVTVLAARAYMRLAAWTETLSLRGAAVHSLSSGPVLVAANLLRIPAGAAGAAGATSGAGAAAGAGGATLRVLTAGKDRYHFADPNTAGDATHCATVRFQEARLTDAEVREMGFPSGLDLILMRGVDIHGQERIAGILGFRSCHLVSNDERRKEIEDLLPLDRAELAKLLDQEAYVVAGDLVTSDMPRLSIAFYGGLDCKYVSGICATFESLWQAAVPTPLVKLP